MAIDLSHSLQMPGFGALSIKLLLGHRVAQFRRNRIKKLKGPKSRELREEGQKLRENHNSEWHRHTDS